MDQHIICTSCGEHIALTDALTKQLTTQIEQSFKAELTKEKQLLNEQKKALDAQKEQYEKDMQQKIDEEKKRLWVIAQQKAQEKMKEEVDGKMKDLEEQNKEKEKKLEEMQKHELELRKQQRELEAKAKDAEVELARKLDEEKRKLELEMQKSSELHMLQVQKNLEEEMQRKMMEKDQQVLQMKKTIDELKRKSEQGSMQLQGDAQEENLKAALERAFVLDRLEDVPTGMRGADLVQTVMNPLNQPAGVMLWESKNTKAWNKDWLKKLKDDQAESGADVSILATVTMPEGIESFGQLDGVWVVHYSYVLPLASLLRQSILEIDRVKKAGEGKDEKMQMLYEYLSGNQFKNRVENIVSAFESMRQDLEAEKRAFQKHWARREKQIERVVTSTTGMYGELEGIIGSSLPQIASLEVDLLGLGDE